MKKLSLVLLSAVLFASCTTNPKGDKAATSDEIEATAVSEGTTYSIDPSSSSITWTGNKVTQAHTGTIKLSSGSVVINEGKLTGGEFSIDMNSLENADLKNDEVNKGKLEGHLKSPDFFDVAAYPTSTFVITEVSDGSSDKVDVSGNLTIRGITKNVKFPITISQNTGDLFVGSADFNINRKDWGVAYEGMKDDLISDEVNFKVSLTAKK